MAISTINKTRAKDEGITEGIICPECNRPTHLRLFSATDRSFIAHLKSDTSNLKFAVCPNCSAVFEVAENYFKERASGTTVFITASDLRPMVKPK